MNALAGERSDCRSMPTDKKWTKTVSDAVTDLKPHIAINGRATEYVDVSKHRPLDSIERVTHQRPLERMGSPKS